MREAARRGSLGLAHSPPEDIMADNLHSLPHIPSKQEDDSVAAQNGSQIVIWTISGDNSEVIPDPNFKPAPIPVRKSISSIANQSSSGVFEVQDQPLHINQREDPGNVKARIAYSGLMVFTGIVLIVVGVISEMKSTVPGGGVPFWVIGSLLLIPGLYCTWDSISTYRQLQMTDRQQIFKDEGADDQ